MAFPSRLLYCPVVYNMNTSWISFWFVAPLNSALRGVRRYIRFFNPFTTIHDGNFRRYSSCYVTIHDGNFRRIYYSHTRIHGSWHALRPGSEVGNNRLILVWVLGFDEKKHSYIHRPLLFILSGTWLTSGPKFSASDSKFSISGSLSFISVSQLILSGITAFILEIFSASRY